MNQRTSHDIQTILIVEDEPSLIFTLKDTLENEGYKTLVAENGMDAQKVVDTADPDLMILVGYMLKIS